MTLVAIWPRQQASTAELVVASDSRLTGGVTFESGPKLFPLPRGDSVIAFAGDTWFAYPLIIQLLRYVDDFDRANSRAQDICDMVGHCERVCSALLRELVSLSSPIPEGIDIARDFTIALAGYSWQRQRFKVWTSLVSRSGDFKFTRPLKSLHGAVFLGSGRAEAFRRLGRMLPSRKRGGRTQLPRQLGWEPFDILRDVIREGVDVSVGGAPQIVKVYRHMNSMTYAVPWRMGGNTTITLLGRPLLKYERTQRLAFHPDSHQAYRLWDYLPLPGKRLRSGQESLPNSGLQQT